MLQRRKRIIGAEEIPLLSSLLVMVLLCPSPTCTLCGRSSKLRSSSLVLGVLMAPGLPGNVIVSVQVQDVLDGPFQVLCALCCLVEGHITCKWSTSLANIQTTSCLEQQKSCQESRAPGVVLCIESRCGTLPDQNAIPLCGPVMVQDSCGQGTRQSCVRRLAPSGTWS